MSFLIRKTDLILIVKTIIVNVTIHRIEECAAVFMLKKFHCKMLFPIKSNIERKKIGLYFSYAQI